jgi:hypothetical protein
MTCLPASLAGCPNPAVCRVLGALSHPNRGTVAPPRHCPGPSGAAQQKRLRRLAALLQHCPAAPRRDAALGRFLPKLGGPAHQGRLFLSTPGHAGRQRSRPAVAGTAHSEPSPELGRGGQRGSDPAGRVEALQLSAGTRIRRGRRRARRWKAMPGQLAGVGLIPAPKANRPSVSADASGGDLDQPVAEQVPPPRLGTPGQPRRGAARRCRLSGDSATEHMEAQARAGRTALLQRPPACCHSSAWPAFFRGRPFLTPVASGVREPRRGPVLAGCSGATSACSEASEQPVAKAAHRSSCAKVGFGSPRTGSGRVVRRVGTSGIAGTAGLRGIRD